MAFCLSPPGQCGKLLGCRSPHPGKRCVTEHGHAAARPLPPPAGSAPPPAPTPAAPRESSARECRVWRPLAGLRFQFHQRLLQPGRDLMQQRPCLRPRAHLRRPPRHLPQVGGRQLRLLGLDCGWRPPARPCPWAWACRVSGFLPVPAVPPMTVMSGNPSEKGAKSPSFGDSSGSPQETDRRPHPHCRWRLAPTSPPG